MHGVRQAGHSTRSGTMSHGGGNDDGREGGGEAWQRKAATRVMAVTATVAMTVAAVAVAVAAPMVMAVVMVVPRRS